MSEKLYDPARWLADNVALRRRVTALEDVVEAARDLDLQPCDFAGYEPKPGLRRWCLTHGEYDRGSGCPDGNLIASLARLDTTPEGGEWPCPWCARVADEGHDDDCPNGPAPEGGE